MKIVLSLVLTTASVIATISAEPLSKRAGPGSDWDYGADKAGPSHWGLLDPAYVTCDKGLQQSPVDINADTLSRFVNCASKALTFDYKPLKDVVAHFNGHTVEVDWTSNSNAHNNTITIGKKVYNLVQFHFHTPNAELHLVHRSPSDQSLAVIGVLLQAQAKNVPFFKYLTALQKKDRAQHPVVHLEVQQLKNGLNSNPYAFVEDPSPNSIEFADGDNEEDEDQVDFNVNMNIVETIVLGTLDKNSKDNINIDNNQEKQDTNIITTNDAGSTTAAAEKWKLPPTIDDIACADILPADEEATHIDLPLKVVDFSQLVTTVKGFTNRWEYSGSLTTPPCSEHVLWNVMHEPFPIGLEQLRALVDLQGYNARMINANPQSKRKP
ncbi:hypothetical protein EC957_003505 [Mortierella hygrophila]|uniref:carbonic anhydrase n=1 Tax=Mortierella hygrophila TaxID=979708 RepID=A0A9P6FFF0_9FUNG|nr:hypothetical protein EC957_003505 [Mortierella hygrophila]